jgi:hypothetical protein
MFMIKLRDILNELEIPPGKWVDMKMSDSLTLAKTFIKCFFYYNCSFLFYNVYVFFF